MQTVTKRAGMAIDFQTKIIRNKDGHFIMIKVLIHQRNITVINAPNNRAPKYMKQKLTELKGKIDNSTIIPLSIMDFNTTLLIMDRTTRKKRSIRK